MGPPVKTILCMKWGGKYGPHYVNALREGVSRHLTAPFRFLCLTDDAAGLKTGIESAPLPEMPLDERATDRERHDGTWRKLAVFRRGLANLQGPVLFLDLDVVITGDLDRLFAYEPDRFCIIRDWLEVRRRPLRRFFDPRFHPQADVNSSVFRYEMPKHAYLFDHLVANQSWANDRFRIEQHYLGAAIGDRAFWPAEWVVSFKRSCRHAFPLNLWLEPKQTADASVVVFHGHPNPDEAIAGYRGSLVRQSRPAPWLRPHWQAGDAGSLLDP
jgi:hypothetical protein